MRISVGGMFGDWSVLPGMIRMGGQSRILLNARVPISSVGEDEGGNVYVTGYQDGVVAMVKER